MTVQTYHADIIHSFLQSEKKLATMNRTSNNPDSISSSSDDPCDVTIHTNSSKTICYIETTKNKHGSIISIKPLQLLLKSSGTLLTNASTDMTRLEWRKLLLSQLRTQGVDVPSLRGTDFLHPVKSSGYHN